MGQLIAALAIVKTTHKIKVTYFDFLKVIECR